MGKKEFREEKRTNDINFYIAKMYTEDLKVMIKEKQREVGRRVWSQMDEEETDVIINDLIKKIHHDDKIWIGRRDNEIILGMEPECKKRVKYLKREYKK